MPFKTAKVFTAVGRNLQREKLSCLNRMRILPVSPGLIDAEGIDLLVHQGLAILGQASLLFSPFQSGTDVARLLFGLVFLAEEQCDRKALTEGSCQNEQGHSGQESGGGTIATAPAGKALET